MPAVNPRITITLTPQIHALLRRLSELTTSSQSALVGELLQTSQPVFERMVQALEAAERLKAESLQGSAQISESLAIAQGRLEQQLGLALDAAGEGQSTLLDKAEAVARRRGRGDGMRPAAPAATASKAKPTPVPVTRGSGTPKAPVRGGASRQAAAQGNRTERGVRRGKV